MVVYSLYRRLTDFDQENEEAIPTAVPAEPTFSKGPPPNYTDIVLDPPPPLYDQVLNVSLIYKKETTEPKIVENTNSIDPKGQKGV